MQRHRAVGEQRIDQEAVGRVDDRLVAHVQHHRVALHVGAAAQLLDGLRFVLMVAAHAFGHVRQRQDATDVHGAAGIDQHHHQLQVGDAEVMEAPQTGTRVSKEPKQRPVTRMQHVGQRVRGAACLVDGSHQRRREVRETALASEVIVDHAGDRGLAHPHDQVAVAHPGQHPRPRRLVVEHLTSRGHVGQVHQHVVLVHVHLAVLNILRMHEHDGIDHADVSQHGGADQTIEVGTGNQAVGFGTHGKNLLLLTVQQRAPPIGQYLPSRAG